MRTSPSLQVRVDTDSHPAPPRHPDRRPTLVFHEHFSFIQRVQHVAAADGNLPAIDHGILASAALALVAEMPEAPRRVIDRALQLIVEKRLRARHSS